MGKKVVEAKVPCSEELKKGHLVQNMQFVSFSILQEKIVINSKNKTKVGVILLA